MRLIPGNNLPAAPALPAPLPPCLPTSHPAKRAFLALNSKIRDLLII